MKLKSLRDCAGLQCLLAHWKSAGGIETPDVSTEKSTSEAASPLQEYFRRTLKSEAFREIVGKSPE